MTSKTLLVTLLAVLLALAHAGTRPEDLKWLQAKKEGEGVVTLESGLMYKGESFVDHSVV